MSIDISSAQWKYFVQNPQDLVLYVTPRIWPIQTHIQILQSNVHWIVMEASGLSFWVIKNWGSFSWYNLYCIYLNKEESVSERLINNQVKSLKSKYSEGKNFQKIWNRNDVIETEFYRSGQESRYLDSQSSKIPSLKISH